MASPENITEDKTTFVGLRKWYFGFTKLPIHPLKITHLSAHST
jgi:hypothetical protein